MNSKQNDVLSFFDNFEAAAPASAPGAFIREVLPPNIGRLARGEHFSVFKREHAKEAASVYNYLISLDSYDDFKAKVVKFRPLLNEGIYMYAISMALLHRADTVGILLPPSWQINPKSYFTSETILHAKREAHCRQDVTVGSKPVPFFSTGTVRDAEFKLAWWREDVMLNGHHYHWHEVYPYEGTEKGNKTETKDRQGELFYYMHQQMIARYDAERLGVGLMRVEPYVNWSRPIQEGYNPHLTDYYGSKRFSARPANMFLADSWQDPQKPVLVSELMYHYNRLLDAVNTGHFKKVDNEKIEVEIDSLGAAVESSCSSPNKALYGSVHNDGHDLLAQVTDPDGRYKSAGGVMGATETAVRDPIFFRWHKFIDNLFVLHKLNLKSYTHEDLNLDGVTIHSVRVNVTNSENCEESVLTTRMEDFTVDISHDMFLDPDPDPQASPNTPVNVKVKKINHDHFEYKIVIKPIDLTYDQLKNRKFGKEGEGEGTCLADRYCECGWPEHMLLPRGTESGMQFDLFVMATDWSLDSPDNLDRGTSYCGLKDEKYPDSRSMGFPFDREMEDETIDTFTTRFPNMYSTPIKIKYTGYKASQ
ncbi:Hemocyanin AA6 chain [Holothuria leucospilota]|uniref:Hemocyanin AA6 chain n=1 Tax=Holothuria leucospilota TaxID=206669 RepID=A0A9Q1BC34_HOLLE|nr:Hemocyanin AA6 chain [Holothuria leucospilota]